MLYFDRWKVTVIFAVLALGLLYALPNALPASVRAALPGFLPSNTINLGLDLQGGSHLLYEVDLEAVQQERLEKARLDARQALYFDAEILSEGYAIVDGAVVIRVMDPNEVERAERVLRDNVSEQLESGGRSLSVAREGATLRLEVTDALIREIEANTVRQAQNVIRRRIDSVGVTEPIIQRQGNSRILVQAPGVRDPELLKQRVGATAQMTFQLVTSDDRDSMQTLAAGALRRDPQALAAAMAESIASFSDLALDPAAQAQLGALNAEDARRSAIAASLAPVLREQADSIAANLVPGAVFAAGDEQIRAGFDPALQAVFTQGLSRDDSPAGAALRENAPVIVEALRDNLSALAAAAPQSNALLTSEFVATERASEPFLIVSRVVELTGEDLSSAGQGFHPERPGDPVVNFRFRPSAADDFCALTSANVDSRFATLLDGVVITAPNINGAICGGSGLIEGGFTVESAQNLAALLNAGALPAPLTIVEERTVGPEVGKAAVQAGSIALILGFIGVIAFMLYAYRLFGLFANIALLANVVLILGALSGLQATLTLPGIAGIILTIGMAVDANVLIFERVREEVRNGRTAANALEAGYRRALSTILDANITTFIAAAVLYMFGSGPVRGFAVTLAIGILTSVFTAFVVSRFMVAQWFAVRRPKTLAV